MSVELDFRMDISDQTDKKIFPIEILNPELKVQ